MDTFWQSLAGLIAIAGPWKAAIVFAERTTPLSKATRRLVALTAVLLAAGIGLAFIFIGKPLVDLFHVNPGAFLVAAGLIVLVFAIRMVLGLDHDDYGPVKPEDEEDVGLRIAIYPLAFPLIMTPVGVAALTAAGAEAVLNDEALIAVIAALAVVMVVNLVVFLFEAEFEHFIPVEVWGLAGKLFGVLLAAFGTTIIFDGLKLLDVVTI